MQFFKTRIIVPSFCLRDERLHRKTRKRSSKFAAGKFDFQILSPQPKKPWKLYVSKAFHICPHSPMNTASIRKPSEMVSSMSWNKMVFLNHSVRLTLASPRPTSSVPQVG